MAKELQNTTKHEWTVKSVKTWKSPDGGGFSCNLYMDNKKVAECYNDGMGGMTIIGPWKSREIAAAWDAHVDAQPPVTWSKAEKERAPFLRDIPADSDTVLDRMVDDYNLARDLKRWSKKGTQTPFRFASDDDGAWRIFKGPFYLALPSIQERFRGRDEDATVFTGTEVTVIHFD